MPGAAEQSGDSWARLWEGLWNAVTFHVPHNTAVVLLGATVLGVACGVVGSLLLLRRRSLVADALSHAALPGVCAGFLVATWIGVNGRSLLVLIPAAAIFGVLGVACVHALSTLRRVKEDAAIGAVLSVFFAVGVVLLGVIQNLPSGGKAGLNQFIFGQAATMRESDAVTIGVIAALALVVCILAFKELRLLCFDPAYTAGLGWPVGSLEGLLLGMVTVLTVVGLSAVGAVLMVALLIIPPAAARFWTHRLSRMMAAAAGIGGCACFFGAAASASVDNLPTGPAIVAGCGVLFIISLLLAPRRGLVAATVRRRSLVRRVARQHLLRALYEHAELAGREDTPATLADLRARRAWTGRSLQLAIRRAFRRGEIMQSRDAYLLTERGRAAAARIVRTHRLWEYFLTTQADIAPSHVDRAADDIEHVLDDNLVRSLEAELRAAGALAPGEVVPRSPHALVPAGGAP